MTITRFDVLAAQLQVKLLRKIGDPVPEDVEKLANHLLPAVQQEITQFHIDSARVLRRMIRRLGDPVPEDIDRVADMSDIEQ